MSAYITSNLYCNNREKQCLSTLQVIYTVITETWIKQCLSTLQVIYTVITETWIKQCQSTLQVIYTVITGALI